MANKQANKPIKIGIIGCGGTGGWLAPLAAYTDEWLKTPSELYLYDPDIVEGRNIKRQNFALIDIGKRKDESFAERYENAVAAHPKDWPNDLDVLFLAVDNMEARNEYKYVKAKLRIDLGNEDKFGQAFVGESKLYKAFLQGKTHKMSCALRDQSIPINAAMAFTGAKILYTWKRKKSALKPLYRVELCKEEFSSRANSELCCIHPVKTPWPVTSAVLYSISQRLQKFNWRMADARCEFGYDEKIAERYKEFGSRMIWLKRDRKLSKRIRENILDVRKNMFHYGIGTRSSDLIEFDPKKEVTSTKKDPAIIFDKMIEAVDIAGQYFGFFDDRG